MARNSVSVVIMKRCWSLILLTFLLAQCTTAGNLSSNISDNNSGNQNTSADSGKASGQTVRLKEQGISLTLPAGWSKDENCPAGEGEFCWLGPDGTKISFSVSIYKPEYGNRSIEDETNSFYQDHKQGGSEDVRFLEIDGVRGVHFRGDVEDFDESYRPETKELIHWAAQRMYKGKRQIIFVTLTSPSKSFPAHRDILYGILNSIKFTQD